MQTALNLTLMTKSTHINIEDLWFYFMFLLSVLATKGIWVTNPQRQNTIYLWFHFSDPWQLSENDEPQTTAKANTEKDEDKKLILIHRVQNTWKRCKVWTKGPIIFHTLYFTVWIIIAACNSVCKMNQKYIFKNKGNETFWKAEADRSNKYKNWRGGIHQYEVTPHGFPNKFKTNTWTVLQLPNN